MRGIASLSVAVLLALISLSPLLADDPVFSGPAVGERITSFPAVAATADPPKTIDFVTEANGKPLVLVFVHKLTRPGAALTRTITAYTGAHKRDGVYAGIVWLTSDVSEAQRYVTRAGRSLNWPAPVAISPDGEEGPGALGLNRNVELTILVSNENKVTANFALIQPSVTDAPKIATEIAKLIGEQPPTQEELTKLAYPGGQAMRAAPGARAGAGENAGAERPGPIDPQLHDLLRAVIQRDADEPAVMLAGQAVEEYVGDDVARQREVVRIAHVIVNRKYGTEHAQKVAEQWIAKYAATESDQTQATPEGEPDAGSAAKKPDGDADGR